MKVLARTCLVALGTVLVLLSSAVTAHEIRPGFLRIVQLNEDQFDVLLRVPAQGDQRLSIGARFPHHCQTVGELSVWRRGQSFVEQWQIQCPGGLVGHDILMEGLPATLTDVLARFERPDGTTQVLRLTPAAPGFVVSDAQGLNQVALTYGALGVEHILLGIDHLLFVLALLIIVPGRRKLIATVTAFTVAHSLTLAAATLGWVQVPQAPVEAIIALSILFVAAEIVHWKQGRPGMTRRRPWVVAFVFGLLHGFGFAGALSDIGLPEHAIPAALLFFNLGVEVGQLLFVAAVLLAGWALRRVKWPDWAWRLPVYGIGVMAAFWTIERISTF